MVRDDLRGCMEQETYKRIDSHTSDDHKGITECNVALNLGSISKEY